MYLFVYELSDFCVYLLFVVCSIKDLFSEHENYGNYLLLVREIFLKCA